MSEIKIGITERGDAGIDLSWVEKINTVDGAILITKEPTDQFIRMVDSFKDKIIVHVTITGLGGSIIEPNVPPPERIYPKFHKIFEILGPDKTILRVDPIIPRHGYYKYPMNVLKYFSNHIKRIRISFMDNYPHVKQRFINQGITPMNYNFHAPLKIREDALNFLNSNFDNEIEVCGEPGLECVGCVSKKDLDILGIEYDINDINKTSKQREECCCLAVKKELLSNRRQCIHSCLYCYWK